MKVVSPTALKADRCNNLWVADYGFGGEIRLLRFDLLTNSLADTYPIGKEFIKPNSNITSIAVEDDDCANLYVYMADSGAARLVVFSAKGQNFWNKEHHYFAIDPVAGLFNVGGVQYVESSAVTGLWLSDKDLVFHPLSSNAEFKVPTATLHDSSQKNISYVGATYIGNRGVSRQAGASAYAKKEGVVFYAMVNLNQLACWRPMSSENYTTAVKNVYNDSIEMKYPSDVRVAGDEDVWVLTNNLPTFLHGQVNEHEINYRIFKSSVNDAIGDTDCNKSALKKLTDKVKSIIPGSGDGKGQSNPLQPMTAIVGAAAALALFKLKFI